MEQSGTDFFTEYIEEVQSYIPQLKGGVAELQAVPDLGPGFDEFYRLVHIIKGASSMVGVHGLSRIAGYLESALDEIREGRLEFSSPVFDAMRETVHSFEQYCFTLRQEISIDEQLIEQRIRDMFQSLQQDQAASGHDVQPGLDELASADFLGILEEDSSLLTTPAPQGNKSIYENLDHFLSLLVGMVTEKRTIAETSLEALGRMSTLIAGGAGEEVRECPSARSPFLLLRELSEWMHESAEFELFRLVQFFKENEGTACTEALFQTMDRLGSIIDEMAIAESIPAVPITMVPNTRSKASLHSIDEIIESFGQFLSKKVTVISQVRQIVPQISTLAVASSGNAGAGAGKGLAAAAVPLDAVLSWMDESAELELYRIVQIVHSPFCLLRKIDRKQLASNLEKAFAGIAQNESLKAVSQEDLDVRAGFERFLAELKEQDSEVASGLLLAEDDGESPSSIESDLFAESDFADELFEDEENGINEAAKPAFDGELAAMFRSEAVEHLKEFDTSIQILSAQVHGRTGVAGEIQTAIQGLRRSVHTIKGASGVLGMQDLSIFSGRIEDFLDWLHDDFQQIDSEIVNVLIRLLDLLQVKICTPEHFDGDVAAQLLESLPSMMEKMADAGLVARGPAAIPADDELPTAPESTTFSLDLSESVAPPDANRTANIPLPQSLFSEEEQQLLLEGFREEAEEHLQQLHASLQSLEDAVSDTCPITPEVREEVRKIRRAVHTIKGASAVIGLTAISGYAHGVEDFLDWLYEGAELLSPKVLQVLAESLDLLGMLVDTPDAVLQKREEEVHRRLKDLIAAAEGASEAPVADVMLMSPDISSAAPESASDAAARNGSTSLFSEEEQQMLLEGFREEADEHLQQLHDSMQLLGNEVHSDKPVSAGLHEEVRKIRRAVHTIKGASAVIGQNVIASYAHGIEDFLDWLYESVSRIQPAMIQVLAESIDALGLLVETPSAVSKDRQEEIHRRLQFFLHHSDDRQELPLEDMAVIDELEVVEDSHVAESVESEPVATAATQIPAKTIRIKQQQFDVLLNLANELLVGVSGFDRNMAFFKSTIEELELTTRRLKNIALELETKFEVKALDQLSQRFAHLDHSIAEMKTQESFAEFDALELDRYTQLNLIIRSLNESTIDVSAIHTNLGGIYSGISGDINRQYRVIRDIQIRMMRTRMSPLSMLAPRLSRTAREVASRLGKQVRFVIEGETVELDRVAWEKLADPFMHLIRNAIHHGLEDTQTRQALMKPEFGTVTLSGRREGNNVVLRLSDDGQGLDFNAIREKAKVFGVTGNVGAMTERQLTDIIFTPGFSTKLVSEISGRGVGMDVVKENVLELQGAVTVETEKGKGTTFVLRIPLTLGVVRALMFRIGNVSYGIALNDIQDIRRSSGKDLIKEEGRYVDGSEVLDYYSVHSLLGLAEDQPEERPLVLVMNSPGERNIALSIPPIIGQKEIVLKSVGSHLRAVPGIAGVAVMGDGSVVPVLNIPGLIAKSLAAHAAPGVAPRPAAQPDVLTVMIVDDSISIRRVMSRLVSANGWNPVEAKDGLDALEILESGNVAPHCIVLDIEMPRMNGFELLTKLPNLPEAKNIPVIMLTSRTSEKHREKALQLGARAFLNKPCKDEDFVDTVLNLTGQMPFLPLESISEALI